MCINTLYFTGHIDNTVFPHSNLNICYVRNVQLLVSLSFEHKYIEVPRPIHQQVRRADVKTLTAAKCPHRVLSRALVALSPSCNNETARRNNQQTSKHANKTKIEICLKHCK